MITTLKQARRIYEKMLWQIFRLWQCQKEEKLGFGIQVRKNILVEKNRKGRINIMNKFYGIGNLVADVKATEVGKSKVAKFKVAVQRAFKNERGEHDVDFLNCVAWDKKSRHFGTIHKKRF